MDVRRRRDARRPCTDFPHPSRPRGRVRTDRSSQGVRREAHDGSVRGGWPEPDSGSSSSAPSGSQPPPIHSQSHVPPGSLSTVLSPRSPGGRAAGTPDGRPGLRPAGRRDPPLLRRLRPESRLAPNVFSLPSLESPLLRRAGRGVITDSSSSPGIASPPGVTVGRGGAVRGPNRHKPGPDPAQYFSKRHIDVPPTNDASPTSDSPERRNDKVALHHPSPAGLFPPCGPSNPTLLGHVSQVGARAPRVLSPPGRLSGGNPGSREDPGSSLGIRVESSTRGPLMSHPRGLSCHIPPGAPHVTDPRGVLLRRTPPGGPPMSHTPRGS